MIHIAICDDSIDELSNMIQLINQYRTCKQLNCEYAVFQNGLDLIAALEKGTRFDFYCLDIIMPAFSGIDTAKELRNFDKTAPIIFFTSSMEFAFESYSVKAINYVLKPVSIEKLFFTFDEVLDRMKIEKDDVIIVKSSEGIQRILLPNLVFAEVTGRNVLYHLLSGKVIECTEPFTVVSNNLLKFKYFIKTHRSYIVNMQYIDTIGGHQIIMQTNSPVPIAQGKSREIRERYLRFQMEED
ncbi:MAG TPA: LytTR family DNA-binding domain-containing protein [Lachnospiraceae bacterium]|nr:LytTR family DNA-binding domain-containing protein [Lachnospiraceae bacterium]